MYQSSWCLVVSCVRFFARIHLVFYLYMHAETRRKVVWFYIAVVTSYFPWIKIQPTAGRFVVFVVVGGGGGVFFYNGREVEC